MVFTSEVWSSTQSRLNNNNFRNEMNGASSWSLSCLCGRENLNETERRDFQGTTVNPPHRYPWMVALVRKRFDGKDEFYCGGVLISPYYVLTAAHCLRHQTIHNTRVALGAYNSKRSPVPVQISVILPHPKFNLEVVNDSYYDIGLLKLQTAAQLGPNVNVACLPASSGIGREEQSGIVVGYALQGDRLSNVFRKLVEVEANILHLDRCLENQRRQDFHRSQICADTYAGDSCANDDAGPLFVQQGGRWFIVGFRDWSVDCRSPSTVVYTRVSEYLPWIESQTRNYPDCITGPLYQPPRKPNIDNCGIPNEMENEHLAGGNNTTPFEFPWMARINFNNLFCGSGALISPKFVLTAASIFDDWILENLHNTTVILGTYGIDVMSEQHEKLFDVMDVYVHRRYDKPTIHNNDLALIQLKEPADDKYRPICLPQRKDKYFPNTVLTIAGWGMNHRIYPVCKFLKKADMNVLSYGICKNKYPGWFTRRMICVYNDGKDACKEDGGAPLMQKHEGRYYLAGVASMNRILGFDAGADPRVFAAVRRNLKWISNTAELDVA